MNPEPSDVSPGVVPPVIEAMLARRSVASFAERAPTPAELDLILAAADTVPDHGGLHPWRFVVVQGDARARFGEALAADALAADPDLAPDAVAKTRAKADLAPCQVVLVASPVEPARVPVWEQVAAASCTGYALVLAADALGLGAGWKSASVLDGAALRATLELSDAERVLGWINVGGRAERATPARPRPEFATRVQTLGTSGLHPWV